MTRTKFGVGLIVVLFTVGAFSEYAAAVKPATPPKAPEAAKSAAPALPKCPVGGEPIDFFASAESPEGPVYFCCKDCIGKYEADKAKYAAAVAEQRKALAAMPKVQVKCPVMGKPTDEKHYVEEGGKKVLFCCMGCPSKYKKEPEKYKAALASSYTYQTKCPVEGSAINAKHFAKLVGGQTVYFCSDESKKSFLAKPDQFVASLKAQGVNVDPAKAQEAK